MKAFWLRRGVKGWEHSDTIPALLYAKLTTRLFLKVNLHPSGARLREEAACRYLLAQSRQINIPFYSTTRDDATYRRRELRKQDGITVVWLRRNGDVAIAYLETHPPVVCLREASRMKARVYVITKSDAVK